MIRDNKIPCATCGHFAWEHRTWAEFTTQRCETCIVPILTRTFIGDYNKKVNESWHDYKRDNLKYIEKVYEEQNQTA